MRHFGWSNEALLVFMVVDGWGLGPGWRYGLVFEEDRLQYRFKVTSWRAWGDA